MTFYDIVKREDTSDERDLINLSILFAFDARNI